MNCELSQHSSPGQKSIYNMHLASTLCQEDATMECKLHPSYEDTSEDHRLESMFPPQLSSLHHYIDESTCTFRCLLVIAYN